MKPLKDLAMAVIIVLVALATGTCRRVGADGGSGPPVKTVETAGISLDGGVAEGVMVYRKDGKPLSMTITADRGAIVCSHFDLGMLEKHGVAAASVQGIKSIQEALDAKVVHVNRLAEELGILPGEPVREALQKMMHGGN